MHRELVESLAPETNPLLSLSGSVTISADGSWRAGGWELVTTFFNFQNEIKQFIKLKPIPPPPAKLDSPITVMQTNF